MDTVKVSDMVPNRLIHVLFVLMMVVSLSTPTNAQVPTAPGVEIDCEDKQPELDVHPLNEPVVEITCTVRNPSSFQESISVEKEWDGMEVDMMLEEDTFDLGPDEEEDFKVTFTGQTRLSSSISCFLRVPLVQVLLVHLLDQVPVPLSARLDQDILQQDQEVQVRI